MNEENGLAYAQMLEIPVSTVNVVKKRSIFSRKSKNSDELKDSVVDSVNMRVGAAEVQTYTSGAYDIGGADDDINLLQPADAYAQNAQGNVKKGKRARGKKAKKVKKDEGQGMGVAGKIVMGEAIAACLIAAGIFVTNIFVPNTVINTFVGSLTAVKPQESVAYTDFKLSPVVSELKDTAVTVTDEGVICFKDDVCVYPVCDGKVASITEEEGGLYTVKISHSQSFCSVTTGLNCVYVAEGDSVKSNLPFAYTGGEGEVRVSMYDGDAILNCYTLSGSVPVWNS